MKKPTLVQAIGMTITLAVAKAAGELIAMHLAEQTNTKIYERKNQPKIKFGFEGKL